MQFNALMMFFVYVFILEVGSLIYFHGWIQIRLNDKQKLTH